MSTSAPKLAPIVQHRDEGEAIWFLSTLAWIKSSTESTGGRVAVIEHLAPAGPGSPLHVHKKEDEWFYVLEGRMTFWVGGEVVDAPSGSFVFGPREVPHTFAVASDQARFLLVAEPAGFERFMRELSRPAEALTLPPPASEPPDLGRMATVAASHGIEILGPPGIPESG